MGARRPWTRLAALGGLALVALVSSSAARADDPATLRSEIERLRAESDGLAARSQEALLELYALETRLARAQGRLAALDARREALEREEAAARRTLELARADVEEAERQLSDHLRELYVQDEVDPLAVILGAESLDEALSAFDGLTRLADLDRSILEDVRAARLEVQKALRALAERSAELRDVVARVEAEQAKLLDARSEREAFIAELAAQRASNERRIAGLQAQAAKAAQASAAAEESEASAEPASTSSPGSTPEPQPEQPDRKPGGEQMVVEATAYCLRGTTASGLPTGWGTVAVDTSVIPFGTRMYIPGYGNGVAADTGSAIVGRIIDVWFPTCAQALAWGRKTLTITIYW
jgi:3D (Asp-Asp-Asp) domain-containing protein/predicted  nucleic acid-binding Zn-ribbon protein